jgi:serine/threonine-protein kinase
MPPEQLWGSELDRTVDVYAASVVLWEMLTGRRLFRGENDAETMKRVVEDVVPPPSSIVPEAAPLDEIVMRGLSRDPSKRFPTAMEMAKAIDRALSFASRLEIGEWVANLAKAQLGRRGELLRAMQRGELAPAPQKVSAVVTALTLGPHTAPGLALSQRSLTPPPRSPLRRGLGFAAGAAAVALAIGGTIMARPLVLRASASTQAVVAAPPVHEVAPAAPPPAEAQPASSVAATPAPPPPAPSAKRAQPGRTSAAARASVSNVGRGAPSAARAVAQASSETPPGAVPAPVAGPGLGSRY